MGQFIISLGLLGITGGTRKYVTKTSLLSNMIPQVGRGFNRDKWEHLERCARKLTKLYRCVYVCTSPR